jgi:hypothetical protein
MTGENLTELKRVGFETWYDFRQNHFLLGSTCFNSGFASTINLLGICKQLNRLTRSAGWRIVVS